MLLYQDAGLLQSEAIPANTLREECNHPEERSGPEAKPSEQGEASESLAVVVRLLLCSASFDVDPIPQPIASRPVRSGALEDTVGEARWTVVVVDGREGVTCRVHRQRRAVHSITIAPQRYELERRARGNTWGNLRLIDVGCRKLNFSTRSRLWLFLEASFHFTTVAIPFFTPTEDGETGILSVIITFVLRSTASCAHLGLNPALVRLDMPPVVLSPPTRHP